MTPDRWEQIETLFESVCARPPEERSRYLRQATDDDALRDEVASLLAASSRADQFMATPALGGVSQVLERDPGDDDAAQLVGVRLGAYRVQRVIASGGMGTVLLACRDDAQFEKKVAIKVIRRGLGGFDADRKRDIMRRFRMERQVLANLDHPNIARLIDGGTTAGGRPYYVMEYIEGQPIDHYCAEHHLRPHEILDLFSRVASAVQYAHQNLVIHRDLKPTNILVTADGEPKLLDFGLAKPLDESICPDPVTMSAAFMGTFHYAAPEQLTSDHGTVDTRTDVYALGLILYRLLTGQPAYPVNGTMSETLAHIAETEPRRPSRIRREVDDEVDTIVLTALSKGQNRRYQSAGAVRQDITRYLAGEPILAKDDSHWYVLRKTARRFRVPLAIAALFVALVGVFGISMAVSADRAHTAERKAAATATSLVDALRFSNIERGRGVGRAGNATFAENLIWPEYLAAARHDAAPQGGLHAHWALWELYSQYPCVATIPIDEPPNVVRFIPTTDMIAALLINGDILISRTHPLRTVQRIATEQDGATVIDASDDGRWLAHAGADHTILLRTGDDWREARRLLGLTTAPSWIQFNAGSTRLVAGTGSSIVVWDIDTTAPIFELDEAHDYRAVVLSPDGTLVAAGCAPNLTKVWDIASGKLLWSFDDSAKGVGQMYFSPDGTLLAAGGRDDTVRVYDLDTGRIVTRIGNLSSFPRSMQMFESRDGQLRLAAAGSDKRIYVWSIPDGALLFTGAGHTAGIIELDIDPERELIVTSSGDRTLKVWESAPQLCMRRLAGHADTVFSVSFNPDGRLLASSSGSKHPALRIWSTTTGALLHDLRGHDDVVSTVAFSPDGQIVASCSYDGSVRLWDPHSGSHLHTWNDHDTTINSLSFASDGSFLATASDDQTIRLWDMVTRLPRQVLHQNTNRIPSVSVHPDGIALVASGGYSRSIVLWNLETMQSREIPGHALCSRAVRFSPDGRWLASSGDDHAIHLWSGGTADLGRKIRTLEGHDRDVFALAFNSDGSILASGDRDGDIKLWETATGLCLVTLTGHTDMVFSVAFSPDDRHLASGSRDEIVALWDLHYYDRHIAGNTVHQERRHHE